MLTVSLSVVKCLYDWETAYVRSKQPEFLSGWLTTGTCGLATVSFLQLVVLSKFISSSCLATSMCFQYFFRLAWSLATWAGGFFFIFGCPAFTLEESWTFLTLYHPYFNYPKSPFEICVLHLQMPFWSIFACNLLNLFAICWVLIAIWWVLFAIWEFCLHAGEFWLQSGEFCLQSGSFVCTLVSFDCNLVSFVCNLVSFVCNLVSF